MRPHRLLILPALVTLLAGRAHAQCGGFSSQPAATTLDSLTATVVWTTALPSSSSLDYGTTTAYGSTATDPNVSTAHSVTLSGLAPRTLYHVQATETDANGSCVSSDRVFLTAPSPGTPGDIRIFFNQTVDNGMARPGYPLAQGSVACDQKLVELINTASTSVDCALYSFSLQNVTNALISAKIRGCAVRLIMDDSNSQAYAMQLQNAGINYITSAFGGNHADGSIMHSKYVVIDAKGAIKDSARVWTGSWNCSVAGQSDAQNVIILRDWGLAQAYTMDFEQMWGSSTTTPDANQSRMGSHKLEIVPHRFRIGGRAVEAWMSPSDQTESHLIQTVQQAQHTEFFALLSFTSNTLSHAMKVHRDSLGDAAFKVRGLFEPTMVDAASEFCKLDGQVSCSDFWSPRADALQDPSSAFALLHHKYAIFDEGYPEAATWTGSHNWSVAANTVNDENSVLVHDPVIANVYEQEWFKRYRESGGQFAAVDPEAIASGIQLSPSRPNPMRELARIGFTLPADQRVTLGVYDLGGRLVKELVSGTLSAGSHEARWDGRAAGGAIAPAGLYFYRLTTDQGSSTRRLVLAR